MFPRAASDLPIRTSMSSRDTNTSIPWREIPDSDRAAIGQLRQTLLESARYLTSALRSRGPLQAFASHPNPSGRNSLYYWSCAYPAGRPNKTFAFQLFVIVKPDSVEFGFGAGAGQAEMNIPQYMQALERIFEAARKRLRHWRDQDWIREAWGRSIQGRLSIQIEMAARPEDPLQFATDG